MILKRNATGQPELMVFRSGPGFTIKRIEGYNREARNNGHRNVRYVGTGTGCADIEIREVG